MLDENKKLVDKRMHKLHELFKKAQNNIAKINEFEYEVYGDGVNLFDYVRSDKEFEPVYLAQIMDIDKQGLYDLKIIASNSKLYHEGHHYRGGFPTDVLEKADVNHIHKYIEGYEASFDRKDNYYDIPEDDYFERYGDIKNTFESDAERIAHLEDKINTLEPYDYVVPEGSDVLLGQVVDVEDDGKVHVEVIASSSVDGERQIEIFDEDEISMADTSTIGEYIEGDLIMSKEKAQLFFVTNNKIKGDIKMNKTYWTINYNFLSNGQEEKYATLFANQKEIVEEYGDIEKFEEDFDVMATNLHYPIIAFDGSGIVGGKLFESTETRENIMHEAYEFFNLDNDIDGIWEFEDYTVYEESDMLRFEDAYNEVLGYVSNHDADLQEELNKGIDPVEDGWEDRIGNTIGLDGWGEFGKQVTKKNNDFEMDM